MKKKYKVERDGFVYSVINDGKFICECDTKHMAYKIKKVLEIVENDEYQYCFTCVHEDTKRDEMPCKECTITNCIQLKSNFQPKAKS